MCQSASFGQAGVTESGRVSNADGSTGPAAMLLSMMPKRPKRHEVEKISESAALKAGKVE